MPFYKSQSPKWTRLGLVAAFGTRSLCYILFFLTLYIYSTYGLKTDLIVRLCCTFFFFFLALGGQSETPASISVPATPQLHAVLVRGRFQRHGEVPEERGVDELTASWNLGESVKGEDFTAYVPISVSALPCLKSLRVPCRDGEGPTNIPRSGRLSRTDRWPFLLRRRGKTRWKADVTRTRMDLTSPRLKAASRSEWIPQPTLLPQMSDAPPMPEPSRLKYRVGTSALGGQTRDFLQHQQLRWRVELVSERLRQHKVKVTLVVILFYILRWKTTISLESFIWTPKAHFLVEDQFLVFIFRCQWKYLNGLFHALCQFWTCNCISCCFLL